jgi:hypothetical protein
MEPTGSLSLRERVRVRGNQRGFSASTALTPALSQGGRESYPGAYALWERERWLRVKIDDQR